MKVYPLYKNVADEIEVLGVFSTQEKVERAIEIFSPLEEPQKLEWEEFEIDLLEQIFDAALSGYQFYHLSSQKHYFGETIFSDNYVYSVGIDSFLSAREDFVYETEILIGASVKAKSKEEAIEKANKMLAEYREQNG